MAVTIAVGPSPAPSPSASPRLIGSTRAATGTAGTLHRSPITASTLDLTSAAAAGEPLDAALRALPGYDRTRANTGFSNYGLDRLSIGGAGTDRAGMLVDGVTALDPINQGIKAYNAYTSYCAANPTASKCGATQTGAAAAPCYTAAGAADPACAAADPDLREITRGHHAACRLAPVENAPG